MNKRLSFATILSTYEPRLRAMVEGTRGVIGGVPRGAIGLVAWWIHATCRRTVIVVTTDPNQIYSDCKLWSSESDVVNIFPDIDVLPFDRSLAAPYVTRERLSTLSQCIEDKPYFVVTSLRSLMRPTIRRDVYANGCLIVRIGMAVARDGFISRLIELGYKRVPAVSSPGDCAVRGGIIDIFSPISQVPWRIEWDGDEIGDIRVIDIASQGSRNHVDCINVAYAQEMAFGVSAVQSALKRIDSSDISRCRSDVLEGWIRDRDSLVEGGYSEGIERFTPYMTDNMASFIREYVSDAALVILADSRDVLMRSAQRYWQEVNGILRQEKERGELPMDMLCGLYEPSEILNELETYYTIELSGMAHKDDQQGFSLGWESMQDRVGNVDMMVKSVEESSKKGISSLVWSSQQQRIEEIAQEHNIMGIPWEDGGFSAPLSPSSCVFIDGELSSGFKANMCDVYTDTEIFGFTRRRSGVIKSSHRRAESTSARGISQNIPGVEAFILPYNTGDFVVHRDHGIGRFLETRRILGDDGDEYEYMDVEYAHGDHLLVPVTQLDRLDRYVGGSDGIAPLSKLGSGEWKKTRQRVKERAEAVARDLIRLYSRREMSEGFAYASDTIWQRELEASFVYEETNDQVIVMEEVKNDMEAQRPMDRLICGDVGFGKTEIAVRAAFKAVMEGKQVSVLVPTTILAQQHFMTFEERLKAFPITIRQLSRMCSEEETRQTLSGLKLGSVDIVIGTHKLLQRDVAFHDLGLVIVDEEQRFGVLQKEKLKNLRVAVDYLSLSATPIPRTLHMSLAGIRDMSVIRTPPEERQPIKTYVAVRDEGLIREVIEKELARGGQVYYVHNRVQSIHKEEEMIRTIVPNARIGIAHGQMTEDMLSHIMRSFMDGDIDVLVCTTIIESGLDIPNVNTIIINDAHKLGLSQLYQLRGRVGRGGQRAYAYVFYPTDMVLTEKADKRLDAIEGFHDLGSGFALAVRDLEIRGVGNILGEEQHGEIAAVGLELYNHLLRDAVNKLQGKVVRDEPSEVTVTLPLRAILPATYISDEALRLRCYHDLAACGTERELERCVQNLVDRFGELPLLGINLIFVLRIRIAAAQAHVTSVTYGDKKVTITLPPDHGIDLRIICSQFPRYLSASITRVYLEVEKGKDNGGGSGWQQILGEVMGEIGRLVRDKERNPAMSNR